MLAAAVILVLIANNIRRHAFRLDKIFRAPLDIFIFSLIVSDLFQGLGSALIIRWVVLGKVFIDLMSEVCNVFRFCRKIEGLCMVGVDVVVNNRASSVVRIGGH